ncbi:MAG: hypothetical protein HY650_11780 [Acidobacteria bacterium]|nr:hypothetical protein [Acidobacteriota bacterium]
MMRAKRIAGLLFLITAVIVFSDDSRTISRAEPPTARVELERVFITEQFCKACHPEHYEQWKDSVHAHAMRTEGMQLAARQIQQMGNASVGVTAFCANCHSPAAMVLGEAWASKAFDEILAGRIDPITHLNSADVPGITCDMCHSATPASITELNQRFRLNAPWPKFILSQVEGIDYFNLIKGQMMGQSFVGWPTGKDYVKYGPYQDSTSLFHGSEFSQPMTEATFCRSCHQYNFPNAGTRNIVSGQLLEFLTKTETLQAIREMRDPSWYDPTTSTLKKPPDNEHWFRIGTVFDNLRTTNPRDPRIPRTYQNPFAERECQDCHMARVDGKAAFFGPERKIHQHIWPGPRRAVGKIGTGAAIRLEVSRAVRRGSELDLRAVVINIGAGHRVPNGCPLGSSALALFLSATDALGVNAIPEMEFARFDKGIVKKDGTVATLFEIEGIDHDNGLMPELPVSVDTTLKLPANVSFPLDVTISAKYLFPINDIITGPYFLGGSDPDAYIPKITVRISADGALTSDAFAALAEAYGLADTRDTARLNRLGRIEHFQSVLENFREQGVPEDALRVIRQKGLPLLSRIDK